MTPLEILDQIADSLANTSPLELIDKLMPHFRADAVTWVRRLPLWDEYCRQHTDQVIAVARVISQRTMREFDLTLTVDGRVVERDAQIPQPEPKPEMIFPLVVVGLQVQVEYTPSYFPGRDGLSFTAETNPLSETGFWHQFAPHDAVEAVGGPKVFAALCAEAKISDCVSEFMEQFEGRFPEKKRPPRRKPEQANRREMPVLGEHTAAVVEPREPNAGEEAKPARQGELF